MISGKGNPNDEEFSYTIMIRQPDFVTQEVVNRAFENVSKKKPHPLLDNVTFATMEDGLSVQMMHIGPYDDEPQSFEQMKKFIFSFGVAVITALFFILLGGVEEKFP